MLEDYFEDIYCINLEERVDRWKHVSSEFKKIKLKKVKKFSAIKNKIGYIGCRDSHLAVIREAKNKNSKNVLIFEDDVVFIEENIKLIPNILEQIKSVNWDLLYFGATLIPKITKLEKISNNLLKTNFAYAAHAYAVNSSVFDFVLNEGSKHPKIDVFYAKYLIPNNIGIISDPMLAFQRPSFSDIMNKEVDYSDMIKIFHQAKLKNNIK